MQDLDRLGRASTRQAASAHMPPKREILRRRHEEGHSEQTAALAGSRLLHSARARAPTAPIRRCQTPAPERLQKYGQPTAAAPVSWADQQSSPWSAPFSGWTKLRSTGRPADAKPGSRQRHPRPASDVCELDSRNRVIAAATIVRLSLLLWTKRGSAPKPAPAMFAAIGFVAKRSRQPPGFAR